MNELVLLFVIGFLFGFIVGFFGLISLIIKYRDKILTYISNSMFNSIMGE